MNDSEQSAYERNAELQQLDMGWVKLILAARDAGLTLDDIQQFLEKRNNTSLSQALLASAAD